jgi:DNA repair protein RecN (Recombination protein N)
VIESIRIRNLGVIAESQITLTSGLTAVTGETGAGKTMLLTGLALLMGGKADASLVRHGSERADVDGEWRLSGTSVGAVHARLEEAGAEVESLGDDIAFTMSRTLAGEGRSRAFAGGRSVPAAVLEEVCSEIIAVHGQSDQLRLKSPAKQRDLLDRFGGAPVAGALKKYRDAYREWNSTSTQLSELRSTSAARIAEARRLADAITEIDGVAPLPGEDVELERQAAILSNSGGLLTDVQEARIHLVGDDAGESAADAVASVYAALRALERASAVDVSLSPLVCRLKEASGSIAEVGIDLASYASDIDADPARQAWVEERRSQLTALKRRYGATVDDILTWVAQSRSMVAEVAEDDTTIAALESRLVEVEKDVATAAGALTKARSKAADALGKAVTLELRELALADASFSVQITSAVDSTDWGSHGADTIEFMLLAHKGGAPRPLAVSASGGELSRVMLAIEVVLAGADPVATFVFDEVDAGIGGRAAVEVGRKLAKLGRTSQVLVVTHLPQVAAFADVQLVVSKGADGMVTSSNVSAVTGDTRVTELVRMLSGLEDSTAGAAHARELLELAESARASWIV